MKKNTTSVIGLTALGTIVCALLALLFFGAHFTHLNRPPFYFLMLGFAGSLSLALFRSNRTRDTLYANVVILFLFAVFTRLDKPLTLVILLIYYSALIAAIYVYVRQFDQKFKSIFLVRPLLLAALVGVFYVAANLIHGLIFITHFDRAFLLGNLPIGFMLGLGYGIALELYDRFGT